MKVNRKKARRQVAELLQDLIAAKSVYLSPEAPR